jgi:hypothetical protein
MVTGSEKEYFRNLYDHLLKEWKIDAPKLNRESYDSSEYQEKATQSGLEAQ